MRILVAPDKFKDSLTAAEAVDAIVGGITAAVPDAVIDRCPLADGGEGTVQAIVQATGGTTEWFDVSGPIPGTRVKAPIGFYPGGRTAIIELATAAGLQLLSHDQRDATRTTSFGVGELLRHAADRGARKIILGVGGSATCDAGIGIAQAWGAAVRMTNGKTYAAADRKLTGADLSRVLSVGRPGPSPVGRSIAQPPLLDTRGIEFVIACDVGNPLFGPEGAAHIFAPQKGATPKQVEQLDAGLRNLTDRLQLHELAHAPGAGAAGGIGFAMAALFGASIVNGADFVFEALRLRERLKTCDLCISGEGRFDAQSLAGKAPIAIARLCRDAGVPCIILAGALGAGWQDAMGEGVTAAFSIVDGPGTLADACDRAADLLRLQTEQVLRAIAIGQKFSVARK